MASKIGQKCRYDLYLHPDSPSDEALIRILDAQPRRQELLRGLLKASLIDAIDRGIVDAREHPWLTDDVLQDLAWYRRANTSVPALDNFADKPSPAHRTDKPSMAERSEPVDPVPADEDEGTSVEADKPANDDTERRRNLANLM